MDPIQLYERMLSATLAFQNPFPLAKIVSFNYVLHTAS